MISISRIFCKVQKGRGEREECWQLSSSSFANPKNESSVSLIKLHAEMERKAENLYPPFPKFMPILCHEGKHSVLCPIPRSGIGADSALRSLTLGIPSMYCMTSATRALVYL